MTVTSSPAYREQDLLDKFTPEDWFGITRATETPTSLTINFQKIAGRDGYKVFVSCLVNYSPRGSDHDTTVLEVVELGEANLDELSVFTVLLIDKYIGGNLGDKVKQANGQLGYDLNHELAGRTKNGLGVAYAIGFFKVAVLSAQQDEIRAAAIEIAQGQVSAAKASKTPSLGLVRMWRGFIDKIKPAR